MTEGNKRGRKPDSEELKAAKDRLKRAKTDPDKAAAQAHLDDVLAREKAAKLGAKPDKEVTAAIWRPEDLDDEQLHVVFRTNMAAVHTADATLEKAKKDRTAAIDKAKAEYGESFLEHMKLDEQFQRDGGKKTFCAKMEGAARIARWNNVPIQEELFTEDRMPLEDRVFEEGKRIGMAGGDPTPPSHYNGPLASRFTEGWHAGQDVARSKLLTMKVPPPPRDLDEGTQVFDYFAAGVEANKRGDVRAAPADYSAVEAKEYERGWDAEATASVEADPAEAA